MTFEERLRLAEAELIKFLDTMVPPRGVSDEKLATIIRGIADAFARKLPLTTREGFVDAINATFTAVKDGHKGYSWPSQADFVAAIPKVGGGSHAAETFQPSDHLESIGRLMAAGEPVAESYIWGRQSGLLVANGHVSKAVMDSYRMGAAMSFREAYQAQGEEIMVGKYGEQARVYFQKCLAYPAPRRRAYE